jgi:hypothetical protein
MTVSRLLLSTLLVPLLVTPSHAQRIERLAPGASDMAHHETAASEPMVGAPFASMTAASSDTLPTRTRTTSTVRAVVGGLIGGTVGTLGGAWLGASSSSGCAGEDCSLFGALVGALIGEPLGLALGVHIGSRSEQHENLLATSLASGAILAGGVLAGVKLGTLDGRVGGAMIPLTPVLQLVTALAIEGR